MIKVLSILQPWASLVVAGHKRIETRSWNTKYRGELYIHASMGKKKEGRELFNSQRVQKIYARMIEDLEIFERHYDFEELPFGAIIGKVDLIDTIRFNQFTYTTAAVHNGSNLFEFTEKEKAFGDYSENRFGWLLSNPVIFDKPIPAKGKLGIWNCDFIGYE